MSKIYQILNEKRATQIKFRNIHSLRTFLTLCEDTTDDVLWNEGQRPLYELHTIDRKMEILSGEYAVTTAELDLHWRSSDNTLRFSYSVCCYDRLCEYEQDFTNDTIINGDNLLKSLDISVIILNKEDAK